MAGPCKVVFFSDARFLGGAEEYLKLLVPEIRGQDYQVRVVLTPRSQVEPLAAFFRSDGIPVDFVETQSSSPLRNFWNPFRYFRRERPSIVHFNLNNTFGCFFPILAAYCCGVPFRLGTEHLAFELTSGKRAGIRTKKLVKKILTFCLHHTVAVSQANKRMLVRDYRVDPLRIKLIRNGIDVETYKFSQPGRERIRREFGFDEDDVVVGTVARFSFQKGHQFTVEAMPRVLQQFPRARFLFVGDGPERVRIQERISRMGLDSFAFFTGEREDVVDLLSAMDVFLLTSIFEGLPLSVLEAMSVGLPVIATRVSGTPEAVLHNLTGLLIPPGDSPAVQEALIQLLEDPEKRAWMGEQGQLEVRKHFSKPIMAQQVRDIYENFVAEREAPKTPLPVLPSARKASIIVLSWNKRELLEECLTAVQTAVSYDGGDHEIILVDNGSTDGTQDFVRIHFPRVRLIELDRNYRFCRANNIAVRYAKNEIVVLLNNDVIVEKDFLRPLLNGFDDDVFAVTSQIFNYDQTKIREETGKTFGTLVFGCIHVGHAQPDVLDERRLYVPVFYAGGGSSAYSREKFLLLGGFNEIYNPGYVEDADLSYRAWKTGYRVLFCPESHVTHKHRSTNATQWGNPRIDYLISRNLFIFFWLNVSSPRLFLKHLMQLPLRLLLDVSRGRFTILRALIGALLKAFRILWTRLSTACPRRLSDEQALSVIDNWFFYRHRYLMNGNGRSPVSRILLVSKRLPKLGFDGSWILVNLIRELSKRYEITLLSFTETEDEGCYCDYLKQFCREVKTITLRPYSQELKSAFLFSKLLAFLNAFLLMRKEVRNELKTGNYDIVQCEYLHTLNFIPDLSRYPSLLTHHEVLSLAFQRQFREADNVFKKVLLWGKWKLTEAYERRICSKVRTVVALSSRDEDFLKSRLGVSRARSVHSGVDVEYFRPRSKMTQLPGSLIFVGYFKHPPNVEGLLYFFQCIWPLVLADMPDVSITVIGRFPPPQILAYSRKDQVTFTDSVPDLRPFLERHAVFVAPIVSGAGLRGKILEAMAMEKAIVATDLCVEGYPFEHGKELMVARNAEEFAAYTVELLRSPAQRRALGSAARARVVREFQSYRFAHSYEEVYEELFQ
ncbi:MAG: glycosyltransferase [Acidobacteriota bacterium]